MFLLRLMKLTAVSLIMGSVCAYSQTRQEHVHQHSAEVMPFDMSATVHVFRMTETGGVLRVVAKDPTQSDQIDHIRHHLQHEAKNFERGDFSDPARLHGANMPGLEELRAGFTQIDISYAALPAGAEIRFETPDLHLLTAVHRWFGAQLSEHGADARAE